MKALVGLAPDNSQLTLAIYFQKEPTNGGQNAQERHMIRVSQVPTAIHDVYMNRPPATCTMPPCIPRPLSTPETMHLNCLWCHGPSSVEPNPPSHRARYDRYENTHTGSSSHRGRSTSGWASSWESWETPARDKWPAGGRSEEL